MSGICDTCKRKPCPAEGEGLKRCDFHVGGESNYEKLFGTPERAARTIREIRCASAACEGCPFYEACGHGKAALLEWLKGTSDGE